MVNIFSSKKLKRTFTSILLGIQISGLSSGIVYGASQLIPTPAPLPGPNSASSSAENIPDNNNNSTNDSSSGSTTIINQGATTDEIQELLDGQAEEIANQLSGGTGVTWGDIYASLNEVDSAVKALNEYVTTKNVTEKDYYCSVVGMYLSQFVSCCQGNLLNIVAGLEENLTDDELNTKLMIGNKKDAVILKDALDYIKESYCVTPVFYGNEDKNIQGVATLRSMYEKEAQNLYIKDTELKVNGFEVTNTKDDEATISKVDGNDAYIPALSYQARNSDKFKINKLDIETVDKTYCVFNSSSACRLALQFTYSELERYNESEAKDAVWQKNDTLLSQGLYLDNFGNIVALDKNNKQYVIILNCMINPTICEIASNEVFNMGAYGVKQVYSSNSNDANRPMGLFYNNNNAYEYVVTLDGKSFNSVVKAVESKDKTHSVNIATRWVSNLLGPTENQTYTYKGSNYFSVFSFANKDEVKENEVKLNYQKDKSKKPDPLVGSKNDDLPTTSLGDKETSQDGELLPRGQYRISVAQGVENNQENSKVAGVNIPLTRTTNTDGMSLAYIKTNHNRATEAFYGYKGSAGQFWENTAKKITSIGGKVGSADRGNLGGYTVMPIPSKCLFYGIGKNTLLDDSEQLKFEFDPLNSGEEKVTEDAMGYEKDYVGFYKNTGSFGSTKIKRYVGWLYTPVTNARVKRTTSFILPGTYANMTNTRDIDANSIYTMLRMYCKMGIHRKMNILNLGQAGDGSNKKPKGLRGYKKVTQEVIDEAYKSIGDYIEDPFDSTKDSPVQGIKKDKIWALGLDIYNGNQDLIEQSTRKVIVYDTCTGKTHTQADYNTVSLFMAVTKNSSSDVVRVTETGELSEEAKKALKEDKSMDILDRVYEMLTSPIKTFMKLVSGFLQWLHTGLSDGKLGSFFYITEDDVSLWFGTMPTFLVVTVIGVFCFRMAVATFMFAFDKKYRFSKLIKNFVTSAALISVPIVCLSTMRYGVKKISDTGMESSTLKIESVYLNKQLLGITQTQESTVDNDPTSKYFIEHFEAKRQAIVGISILNNSKIVKNKTVNPNKGRTSKFEYETYNVGLFPALLTDIAKNSKSQTDKKFSRVYDGENFRAVLHDKYDESVFFYFLDYYLNEWVLLNAKYDYFSEDNPNWATTMLSEMTSGRNSFRNLYNKRAVVYGPTAGMSYTCVDDIFGLGQLFYHDGDTPKNRGYYLPIEIFDSNMKVGKGSGKDKTRKNGTCDLWNGYRHGTYFGETSNKEYKISNSDTEDSEKLGNCKRNMGYGFEFLERRASEVNSLGEGIGMKSQVIASEAVFLANGIPTKYASNLEQACWQLNDKIYNDVIDYFHANTGEVNDLTDAVMLAAICTFNFNSKFGTSFDYNNAIGTSKDNNYVFKLTEQIQPISFSKSDLDMDTILKAIYAGDKEVKEEYDIMYYLGSDSFGAFASIILIVAEIFMIVYIIVRMVHLLLCYLLTTFVSTFQYTLKQRYGNKAWLGTLAQAVYFLVAHAVMIGMLNLCVCNSFERNSFTSILMSVLLFAASAIAIAIEITVMWFMIKNFRDMGGSVIADKVSSAFADIKGKIKGAFKGDMKSEKIEVNADEATNKENNDDDEIKESGGGNTELVESVQQAERVRGENIQANSGLENATPELGNLVPELAGSSTGGETFGNIIFDIDSNTLNSSVNSVNSSSFSANDFSETNNTDSSYSSIDNSYGEYDNSYSEFDNSFSSTADNSYLDRSSNDVIDNSTNINNND